ncbi:hypothetical protein DVH05_006914 [Phytophthora capsici]|nr:hypothetical protein DVH05_006914 [Phytophthora capsici]
MATTHQSVRSDQEAEESGQPEVGADPPSPSPVQHDQSPTSQEKDDTTSQRVTSTEDLLEIRDPSVERAQPNAPVVRLPADESIPASTTGSGFLDSDCEDTETEICFLDDDDELERARYEATGVSTADESSLLSDSEAESTLDDDADSNDQDCAETLADSYPPRAWNVLPKHEMVDFAKDPNNMAEMRASGWTLDAAGFPPDERYPDLYTGPYGPTDEVVALADSPLKLFLFVMPKYFWVKVAAESHRYFLQNLTTRMDRMFAKQKTPNKKSKEEFMDKESKKTRNQTS